MNHPEKQGANVSALSNALNDANHEAWSTRDIQERAAKAGFTINHATVAKYLNGTHAARPTNDVLEAFAAVFSSLSIQQLRQVAGLGLGEPDPYEPPQEAHQLDSRQRRAVDEVIRLLAHGNAKAGEGDDRSAAAIDGPRVAPGYDRELRAVASEGDPADADAVDEIARKARERHDRGSKD